MDYDEGFAIGRDAALQEAEKWTNFDKNLASILFSLWIMLGG